MLQTIHNDGCGKVLSYRLGSRIHTFQHCVRNGARIGAMSVEVLLIEDNPPEAWLVQLIVAQSGVPVSITTANDCSGALARLSDVRIKPNLVIADMGALEFKGVEILKRCNPRGIPVVVFSGALNPKDRENVLRLGAKEFVEKPTTLDEYTDALRKMIGKWAVREA
jgi:DNA-binding NtrC family response regulator